MAPIWQQAFRPFFLLGCLFAIVSMSIWGLFLGGVLQPSPYGSILFWHAHEMVFGFVTAIVVGFLLTAVQNWTGIRATHGWPLKLLVTLWLVARVLMLNNSLAPNWLIAVIDTSFLLFAAILFSNLLIKARQFRNLFLALILILLAAGNWLTHLSVLTGDFHYFTWGLHTGVIIITLIMIVISGRVIPMFTANGTQTSKVPALQWLERTAILSTVVIVIIFGIDGKNLIPKEWLGSLFVVAALSNALRVFRWRTWLTLKVPLVWSLHLAYWFIPLSFLFFAFHHFGFAISESTALHGLTAGAMSALILTMMARVSLGHTGRPLQPHRLMSWAFIVIVVAAIFRIVTGLFSFSAPTQILIVAALLWAVAFFVYLGLYYRVLTASRADGKIG